MIAILFLSFLPSAYSVEDGNITDMGKALEDNDNISSLSSESSHLILTKTVQNITQNTAVSVSVSAVANLGDILVILMTKSYQNSIKFMNVNDLNGF